MPGLLILILFDLLGWALQRWAHVPLPENVLGMMLLFVALAAGVVKIEWVEDAAQVFLRHMMLFFAPFIVGILPLLPLLQNNWAPAAGGLIASTVVTLLGTAVIAQYMMRSSEDADAS